MVATAVDGTVEVVLDGKTGLTVPPDDPAALATAISRMLAAPELVRSLGRAGCQFVLEHFSRERQVQQTEALYLDAWHRSRRGRVPASGIPAVGAYQEVLTRHSK